VDGRLVVGNGHVLATFVGPLEMPEPPLTEVHDKLGRVWLGYSAPQQNGIGLAPTVVDTGTGQRYTVGPCDSYRFEDGAVLMDTDLAVGRLQSQTYGAWERPVLIRRFVFTPNATSPGPFRLETRVQLYADYDPMPPATDTEARKLLDRTYPDRREIPPAIAFPEPETIERQPDSTSVLWSYANPYYRRVALRPLEEGATVSVSDERDRNVASPEAVFTGESYGRAHLATREQSGALTLTVALAFSPDSAATAATLLAEADRGALTLETVQAQWREWFEKGAVLTTGHAALDTAYRNQTMGYKLALDAELGGLLVGSRYHLTTVWSRDGGVGVAALLAAGHYEDARKALEFFSRYATWDVVNHALHANYHASGRVIAGLNGAGQPPVNRVVYPFRTDTDEVCEWNLQMTGPQLDGMAYWLYNVGMYERLTGDLGFVRRNWDFVVRIADSLATDLPQVAIPGQEAEIIDPHKRFQRYHPETGLIVDMCYEDGNYRESLLMNGMTVMGLRQAHRLSALLGAEVRLWGHRADLIDTAIRQHLVRVDAEGEPLILESVTRPWLNNGRQTPMPTGGYPWTVASVVPYFNWRDDAFRTAFARQVQADAVIGGWGMWWAELAHAAFEAELPETAWNYLQQVTGNLPISRMMYEHHQDVVGSDGSMRHATLNLFGYAYLPHALIRGLVGLGHDQASDRFFLRPQIPSALDQGVSGTVRLGETRFRVEVTGTGNRIEKWTVDGVPQTDLQGFLQPEWLDGTTHRVTIAVH
jgi:hypothetical protein